VNGVCLFFFCACGSELGAVVAFRFFPAWATTDLVTFPSTRYHVSFVEVVLSRPG